MRGFIERGRVIRLLIALALLLAPAALAADDTGLIESLRKRPVFVDPEAKDASADTEGVLLEQLKPRDGIVILMFREGAAGDPPTVAADVNRRLGGHRIVAVAVGDKVAGYSTILPYGVAAELMKRAATVSTSTPETLGTFIQNVHDWQTAHPNAPAAKPVAKEKGGLITPMRGILLTLVILIIAVVVVAAIVTSTDEEDVRLKKSPDRIKDQLERMLKTRDKIEDVSLRALITQIASDIEALFSRTKTVDASDREALTGHLVSLNKVLEMYVDVQDNERYFHDPNVLLANGHDATAAFAEFVLEMVQREGRRTITDFRVDTDILSAQRYR